MIVVEWDRILLAALLGLLGAELPMEIEAYPILLRAFAIVGMVYLLGGAVERYDPPGVG